MKRIVAMVLALMMTLVCVSAMAAGKLQVTQENYYTISSYSTYGYAYAKVENVGDKPIKVNTGLLEIYNADGEPLASTDYLRTFLTYLEPGQYTYVSAYSDIKDEDAAQVDDYMLTVAGKSDARKMIQLPCETKLAMNVEEGYWTHNYMYVNYTNNTDQPIWGVEAVMALLDAEGNILYMDNDNLYDSRALMPGSSMMIRIDINSSFIEYYEANGLTPASVDAIVYAAVEE